MSRAAANLLPNQTSHGQSPSVNPSPLMTFVRFWPTPRTIQLLALLVRGIPPPYCFCPCFCCWFCFWFCCCFCCCEWCGPWGSLTDACHIPRQWPPPCLFVASSQWLIAVNELRFMLSRILLATGCASCAMWMQSLGIVRLFCLNFSTASSHFSPDFRQFSDAVSVIFQWFFGNCSSASLNDYPPFHFLLNVLFTYCLIN